MSSDFSSPSGYFKFSGLFFSNSYVFRAPSYKFKRIVLPFYSLPFLSPPTHHTRWLTRRRPDLIPTVLPMDVGPFLVGFRCNGEYFPSGLWMRGFFFFLLECWVVSSPRPDGTSSLERRFLVFVNLLVSRLPLPLPIISLCPSFRRFRLAAGNPLSSLFPVNDDS